MTALEKSSSPDQTGNRFWFKLEKVEIVFAGVFLFLLAFLPVAEILVRLITRSGIPNASFIISHLLIWVAFLAGMLASREGEHLSLASGWHRAEKRLKTTIKSAISILGAAFCIGFALTSLSFLLLAFEPGQKIGFISYRVAISIMPIGFFVMAVRFLSREKEGWPILIRGIIAVIIGLFFGLSPISSVVMNLFPSAPDFFFTLSNFYFDSMVWLKWVFIVLVVGCGIFGSPIFILLGGLTYILFSGNYGTLEAIPNEAYNLLIDSNIPAIPLFTLAGFILSESKAGERLVKVFKGFLGWLPGGLVIMTVLVCAFFTSFTGASGVTILALGGLLSFIMTSSGHFGEKYTQGLITSAGSIGLLFPPSLPIIMYGVVAQYNIKYLFMGGLIPGGLMVLALVATGFFVTFRNKKEQPAASDSGMTIKESLLALVDSLGEMILPILILVLIFSGLTDLVGTASVAVLYVFILEFFIKKDLRIRDLFSILKKSLPIIGGVLIILIMAKALSNYLIDAGAATLINNFFAEHVQSKIVFLLVLTVILLITGCLMDIYSAILVVAPLVIPLGKLYGIHPVQMGVIFFSNLMLGYLTPPVGLNLFLASYTFKKPLSDIYKSVWPFLLILLAVVILITFVPWFSLALIPPGE